MNKGSFNLKSLENAGIRLYDCEHSTPVAQTKGIPYIAIPDIQDGRIVLDNARLISRDDYIKWTKKLKPLEGDIVLTRRGRVGDTAPIPAGLECAIGQNLVILRSESNEVEQAYLRWVLRSPQYWDEVNKYLNVGAVFGSLNCRDITKFEIPVPPLSDQYAIAQILDSFDDKIELNRRMNETMEEIARTIFKSWFVNFNPVQAKSRGEQPPGMDAATADLFPNHFEESELGPIPAGWRVEPLSNHINARKGLSYKGDGLAGMGTGLPMHNLNSVYEGGGYKYEGIKYYSGEYQERHIAKAGDVIVANTEQGHNQLLIGYPAIIPQRYQGACIPIIFIVLPLMKIPISLRASFITCLRQAFFTKP